MKRMLLRRMGLTAGTRNSLRSFTRQGCLPPPLKPHKVGIRQRSRCEHPSWRFERHIQERLAVQLFRLEWRQTKWRDRLANAVGGCEVREPLISTFRLFHLGLDLIGVPAESKTCCRDRWFDHYGATVRSERDIRAFVAWAIKEAVAQCSRRHRDRPCE
jgi:hypothetical protein